MPRLRRGRWWRPTCGFPTPRKSLWNCTQPQSRWWLAIRFHFPPKMIMVAVRWYLRYRLSYRDVEELLTERGIEVDHVSVFRCVQRFTSLLIDAARPCRHSPGDRWFVGKTHPSILRPGTGARPTEVTADRAQAYPRVLDELALTACHVTEQYANNPHRSRLGVKEVAHLRVLAAFTELTRAI